MYGAWHERPLNKAPLPSQRGTSAYSTEDAAASTGQQTRRPWCLLCDDDPVMLWRTTYIVMGVTPPRLRRRSAAWSEAGVGASPRSRQWERWRSRPRRAVATTVRAAGA